MPRQLPSGPPGMGQEGFWGTGGDTSLLGAK